MPLLPVLVCACSSVFQTAVLDAAGGPRRKTEWRTVKISLKRDLEHEHLLGLVSEFDGGFGDLSLEGLASRCRSTSASILGKRSLISPRKMPKSA